MERPSADPSAPPPETTGNRVEALVDGEEMFLAMTRALEGARRHIHLMQLLAEPGFVAVFSGGPPPRSAPPRVVLGEALLAAARRGVRVRILLNENAVVWDTLREMREFFRAHRADAVEVRGFPLGPHALHGKFLLVDGSDAFVVGPPFEQRFWDATSHHAMDPRRRTDRPIHDVSIRVRGPMAADAEALFSALWNLRPGETSLPPRPLRAPDAGEVTARLARTLPAGLLPAVPQGERGILQAYLSAIGRARRWIYLESQYFTSPTITRALGAALERGVEVLLVLNEDVDIPTYGAWQRLRLSELGWPDHPRLSVATLWTPVLRPGGWRVRPIYVHSKVGIVDDAWGTVGAANLDSFGLEEAEEFLIPLPANVEANVILSGSQVPRRLRQRLWREHAGPGFDANGPPAGGWAAAWRQAAEGGLAALERGERPLARILPFGPRTPRAERVVTRGP